MAHIIGLLRPPSGGAVSGVDRLGTADAWLLRSGSDLLLVKRGRPEQDGADATWEHDHLRRLQGADFPTSVPLPAFDGRSWARVDGRIWAALWRSARAVDSDIALDPDRVTRFVRGYHRESPIPPDLAHAIPLLIQALGLMLSSRRVRRLAAGVPDGSVPDVPIALSRTLWVHEHRHDLSAAVDAALHTNDGPSPGSPSHG